MSSFSQSNIKKFITHTPLHLERIDQELIGCPFKKRNPRGHVEVVQDENEDTNVRDEIFQVNELVEPYRVAPSIELEENSNFRVFKDSLVDVDAEELNVFLSSSGQANVDEEDDIHIKDCDEGDDNSIDDEEEENSD
jgi:hypothetical protein